MPHDVDMEWTFPPIQHPANAAVFAAARLAGKEIWEARAEAVLRFGAQYLLAVHGVDVTGWEQRAFEDSRPSCGASIKYVVVYDNDKYHNSAATLEEAEAEWVQWHVEVEYDVATNLLVSIEGYEAVNNFQEQRRKRKRGANAKRRR